MICTLNASTMSKKENNYPCNENVLALANYLLKDEPDHSKKYHAVVLYDTEWEVGIPPERKDVYVRRGEPRKFTSYEAAMDCYCNTPNPASQIFSADTMEELDELIKESDKCMNDSEWVKEFLLPTL